MHIDNTGYRRLRFLLAFSLLFAAGNSLADCLVATNPPSRMLELADITASHNATDTGFIHVAFANGDQMIAHYGLCDLSLDAAFLLTKHTAPDKHTLLRLLDAVAPSEAVIKQLQEQLANLSEIAPDKPIELEGINDSHTFTLYVSQSPLFEYEWHYHWNSPTI